MDVGSPFMGVTVEHRGVRVLKVHPLNERIYGTDVDPEFVDSCKGGIHTPLLITSENIVISGHRRLHAATVNDLHTVPVIVRRDLTDPLDIEEALILSNKQREKTTAQKTREYERIKGIETERAERRQKSGKKVDADLTKKVSEGPPVTGEAGAIAAAKVGMSRPTAERAVKVVKEIDRARKAGDTNRANQLEKTLNMNVSAALREATMRTAPPRLKREIAKNAARPVLGHSTETNPSWQLSLPKDPGRAAQALIGVCGAEFAREVAQLILGRNS